MERVTNVFCGGGGAAAVVVPEKPSRGVNRGALRQRRQQRVQPPPHASWEQLMHDERFLARFFLYFSATERCVLAQVSAPKNNEN